MIIGIILWNIWQMENAAMLIYVLTSFLRASQLVRRMVQCGLLATNTIAQGDTREVGLDQISICRLDNTMRCT